MTTLNERDIEAIKGAFTKDDPRLFMLRSLLMGFELSAEAKTTLKTLLSDSDLRDAVKRKLYPSFHPETQLGGLSDVWGGAETQIMGKDKDSIKQIIGYKEKIIEMMKAAFDLLEDPFGKKVDISIKSLKSDPLQTSLVARNIYIGTVDKTCLYINAIVSTNETPEQMKKRLERDSAR